MSQSAEVWWCATTGALALLVGLLWLLLPPTPAASSVSQLPAVLMWLRVPLKHEETLRFLLLVLKVKDEVGILHCHWNLKRAAETTGAGEKGQGSA